MCFSEMKLIVSAQMETVCAVMPYAHDLKAHECRECKEVRTAFLYPTLTAHPQIKKICVKVHFVKQCAQNLGLHCMSSAPEN